MSNKLPKSSSAQQVAHRSQSIEFTKTETSLFIGPLPAPEILEKYEQIHPGLAERILMMAEKEQDARLNNNRTLIEMERRNLRSTNWNIIRAQLFALLSVLIIVGLCAYFAWLGNVAEASSSAKWIIVGLATAFITGRFVSKGKGPKE